MCNYQATKNENLTRHIKSIHEGIKYPCKICNYKAKQQGHLTVHIKTKHKGEGKTYQCNSCGKMFKSYKGRTQHIESIHEGKSYDCNICKYSTTRKLSLSQHIKFKHIQENSFLCELCNYQATLKVSLERHIKNVHQPTENVFCTDCNKSMKPQSLYKHRRKFHPTGEVLKHYCKICNFQSIHKEVLKEHNAKVHYKIKK